LTGAAALALPQHEFGLDVIALTGTLRYREHRSVPEIHQEPNRRAGAPYYVHQRRRSLHIAKHKVVDE
jgi:hypothetical protein